MSFQKRRLAFVALGMVAAGASGLFWLNQVPNQPFIAPSHGGTASKTQMPSARQPDIHEPTDAAPTAAGSTLGAPAVVHPVHRAKANNLLTPYVALALTTQSQTTEELCPELAVEFADGETADPANQPDDRPNAQGCVLPIGGVPEIAMQQASMPLERPTPLLQRHQSSFLPIAGGLGAAIAAVPIIGGLSKNKVLQQPVSPE